MSADKPGQFSQPQQQRTPTPESVPELLAGEQLKRAMNQLAAEFKAKIVEQQNGVPTMLDNALLSFVEQLKRLPSHMPWEESSKFVGGADGELLRDRLQRVRYILSRRSQGRFVAYESRALNLPGRSITEIGDFEMLMSQGTEECMHWKGMPLFKTVYDFSLYTMLLWNLKPATVIELGSGTGSSAVWFADLLKTFGLTAHVYSVDLKRVELEHDGVTFIQGNSMEIEKVLDDNLLRSLPHPWLFMEDAHANVVGVLRHFHTYFEPGDYVVVEDSIIKQDEIGKFLQQYPDAYRVDTRYTDFFGRNATCSPDSIFVRV